MLISFIYLVVVCVLAVLVYWAVDKLGTPEPINRIVKVAVVIFAVVVLLVIFVRLMGLDIDAPLLTH